MSPAEIYSQSSLDSARTDAIDLSNYILNPDYSKNYTITSATFYWIAGTNNFDWTNQNAGYWSTTEDGLTVATRYPRSTDDIVFGTNGNIWSGNIDYTVTFSSVIGTLTNTYIGTYYYPLRCKNITFTAPASGIVTWTGTLVTTYVSGNISLASSGVLSTYVGLVAIGGNSAGSFTVNFGGKSIGVLQLFSWDSTYTLTSALTLTKTIFVISGILNFSTYSVTVTSGYSLSGFGNQAFYINYPDNYRTLNCNSSIITLLGKNGYNGDYLITDTYNNLRKLTLNYGTSTFKFSQNIPGLTTNISLPSSHSFYNLTFYTPSSAAGLTQFLLGSNISVTNILSFQGGGYQSLHAGYRGSIATNYSSQGTQATITAQSHDVNSTDFDFCDIVIAGTAAPISGTRFGNTGNCSGINFDAPKTVYRNHVSLGGWYDPAWATSATGTPNGNNAPLPQDIATFTQTGSSAATISNGAIIVGSLDTSLRTTSLTFNTNISICGNVVLGSGTVVSAAGIYTKKRTGIQTITSSGKTFSYIVVDNGPNGNVVLNDAFTANVASLECFVMNSGNFDANIYNVTIGTTGFNSLANFTKISTINRKLNMGTGTWTITNGSGGASWNASANSNLTIYANTSTILISNTNINFVGGNYAYNKITHTGNAVTTTTISGNNSFSEISSTKTANLTINFVSNTINNVAAWSAFGSNSTSIVTCTGNSFPYPMLRFTNNSFTTNTGLVYTNFANVKFNEVTNTPAYTLKMGSNGSYNTSNFLPVSSVPIRLNSNGEIFHNYGFDEVTLNPKITPSIAFSSTNNYLQIAANTNYSYGTNNFTIEAWVKINSSTANAAIAGAWTGTAATSQWAVTQGNTNPLNLAFYISNGSALTYVESTSTCFTVGTWNHIAVVRSSNTLTMYSGGALIYNGTAGAYTANQSLATATLQINGYNAGNTSLMNLSNFRITKGIAVYTGAFTVPSSPLQKTQSSGTNITAITDSANTSLLIANIYDPFMDVSNNNVNVLKFGPPSISYDNFPTFSNIVSPGPGNG
jgi:hypothetical protein